ncbi:uncharacterized protein V1513DRAFT_424133 [Lipomyces chichibuensis]|uniref:uncharacterized protein n=1 Tax=Lipomyces chichibuensis TaxID=1546026 RepID=UPI00334416D4
MAASTFTGPKVPVATISSSKDFCTISNRPEVASLEATSTYLSICFVNTGRQPTGIYIDSKDFCTISARPELAALEAQNSKDFCVIA